MARRLERCRAIQCILDLTTETEHVAQTLFVTSPRPITTLPVRLKGKLIVLPFFKLVYEMSCTALLNQAPGPSKLYTILSA